MHKDKLSIQSMDFAVDIINLVKELKSKKESIISNQIGRSGTSIGANIREAHYAHLLHKHRQTKCRKIKINFTPSQMWRFLYFKITSKYSFVGIDKIETLVV